MFGSGKLKEMETQLTAVRSKLDNALKEKAGVEAQLRSAQDRIASLEKQMEENADAALQEKTDLMQQLDGAKEQIADLEKQLAESEGAELQKKARDTIVEYEGLKELYVQKNKEIDANREGIEEGFAREAATKRYNLEEEIKTNRRDNENKVAETVQTFAGSYAYYMNQIRALMDAMSQAARETGESLFSGEGGDIKERFGARILEHLHNDSDALKEGAGDILLIGQKEIPAEPEKAEEETAEIAEEAAEPGCEALEEIAEEAEETVCEAAEEAEEPAEIVVEAADEVTESVCEAAEEAAEEAEETVCAAAGEAEETVCAAAEEAAETVCEAAEEAEETLCEAEEVKEEVEEAEVPEFRFMDEDAAGFVDAEEEEA